MRVDNITTVVGDTGYVQQDWISAGTVQAVGLGGTTSAPTIATTTVRNNISYKRIGPDTYQVVGVLNWTVNTGAADGNGDYLFTLPASLQFDTTLPMQPAFQGNVQTNNGSTLRNQLPGSMMTYSRVADNYSSMSGGVIIWDATRYRISINNVNTANQCWGSTYCPMTNNAGCVWYFTFQTP